VRRHTEDRAVRSRHGETVDHEGSYAIVIFGAFAVPAVSSSPIAVLSRQVAPLGEVAPQARAGLLEVLESVPDPRKKRGVRHRFAAILFVSVCAVVSGARSFAAIAEWAADAVDDTLRGMGIGAPNASTIRRALSALSGDGFDTAIGGFLAGRLATIRATAATVTAGRVTAGKQLRRHAIAVDGKVLRGSRAGDGRPRMLMACLEHSAGVTLGQVEIGEKTNEIPMFSTLLDKIDYLAEVVVTADALHAQREHAEYLHRRGAHYVLTVKGNQPSLRRQLASQPWKDVPVGHRETDNGHGRTVTRTYKVITIAAGILFPHAAQAVQITRTRKHKGKGGSHRAKRETVYAITSLTAEQAPPAELARYIRGHWHVENKLHWVRDVTMGEDASRIATGAGPRAMAGTAISRSACSV
jgi:predicted transposase YbfD/YdcC